MRPLTITFNYIKAYAWKLAKEINIGPNYLT